MFRVSEVSQRLRISNSKVYELVESGALPHYRIGGAIRVSEEQLSAYLEKCKREDAPRERKPRRRGLKFMRV